MADTSAKKVKRSRVSLWLQKFKAADRGDKKRLVTDLLFNNAMYIIIAISVIFIAVKVPAFLSISSIVNIISLTAAKLPIALGIGGAIVLTGTDISAGRAVGLTACIAASLLQIASYPTKMFPNLPVLPIPVVITAFADKSFTFIMKTPPATILIKKAAKIEKGSARPHTNKVGKITRAQAEEIAKAKEPDLTAADLGAAVRTIAGSARSMGITVEGL